jgi:hypothetical protein
LKAKKIISPQMEKEKSSSEPFSLLYEPCTALLVVLENNWSLAMS